MPSVWGKADASNVKKLVIMPKTAGSKLMLHPTLPVHRNKSFTLKQSQYLFHPPSLNPLSLLNTPSPWENQKKNFFRPWNFAMKSKMRKSKQPKPSRSSRIFKEGRCFNVIFPDQSCTYCPAKWKNFTHPCKDIGKSPNHQHYCNHWLQRYQEFHWPWTHCLNRIPLTKAQMTGQGLQHGQHH